MMSSVANTKRYPAFSELCGHKPVGHHYWTVLSQSDLHLKWYTDEEQGQFKRMLLEDLQKMSTKLATTPMSLIDQEELYECIGIEVYVIMLCAFQIDHLASLRFCR